MPSLREIKDRIGSVKSTLKITGAMKLVASSKLRKAQKAIETLRPYERTLSAILSSVLPSAALSVSPDGFSEGLPEGFSDCSSDGLPDGFSDCSSDGLPDGSSRKGGAFSGGASSGGRKSGSEGCGESAGKVAVVVITSNSSLCGAFNANAVKKALEVLSGLSVSSGIPSSSGFSSASSGLSLADVYAVGRKGAEAMRKAGIGLSGDWNSLSAKPSFSEAAALAAELCDGYNSGRYSRVILVYNHFVSTSRQEVTVETYLPFSFDAVTAVSGPGADSGSGTMGSEFPVSAGSSSGSDGSGSGTMVSGLHVSADSGSDTMGSEFPVSAGSGVLGGAGPGPGAAGSGPGAAGSAGRGSTSGSSAGYIVEPDPEAVLSALIPKVLNLKIYASVLDSAAAEHAARTVAMQTASDNAEDILSELTLEYNKSRQQKITSELLDILGGKAR